MNTKPVTHTLLTGISLRTIRTEKFKTNRLSLNFVFPISKTDAPYYALIAEVMKHGCRSYPSLQALSRHTEELYDAALGISVSRSLESEIFTLSLDFLRNRYTEGCDLLGEAIALLCTMLKEPLLDDSTGNFPIATLRLEQENLLSRVRALYNNKIRYAASRCRTLMCEGELYALSADGSEESIAAMELSRTYEYFKKLLHSSRVEIFYIGDESGEEIAKRLMPLSDLLGEREAPLYTVSRVAPRRSVQSIMEEDDTVQSKLCMGYRISDMKEELRPYLPMFLSVISGSPSAKLFKNVREKRSLCYYCSMGLDAEKRVAFVNSGIELDKRDVTVAAVEEEIAEMQKGNISDAEMEYAKKSLLDSYMTLTDSTLSIEGFCLGFLLRNEEPDLEKLKENAEAATKEQLSEIAKCFVLDTVFFLAARAKETGDGEVDTDAV